MGMIAFSGFICVFMCIYNMAVVNHPSVWQHVRMHSGIDKSHLQTKRQNQK